MAGFISNILWNSVEGFVEAGTRTAGGYAGDALIKAGDLIEGGGRKVGSGLERTASGYGQKISVTPKRSNSMPASTKAGSARAKAITQGPTSKVPIGGNKYPGGKGVPGRAGAGQAQKKIASGGVGLGKGVTGGVVGGMNKAASVSGAAGATAIPKPYPNAGASASALKNKTTSSVNSTAGGGLPKPYPSYANAFSNNNEKKTAVKPGGKPKPFNSAAASKSPSGSGAVYPGTSTPVGGGKPTPVNVRKQTYKPMERMSGVAEKGKVQHIGTF
ncbi:hypothetical protein BCR34DRAFT_575223 [Clohesyomyces aquaticus]|uniref:Uncharacterized protein n=1 Tax=Clohesyomyces aquaticus TaxID=1231657 RepID=A0A1Y1YSM7_9PLEO|nr:hypothetical protein BCR34DRAFT_575223 [Clohesyomyces aquaticus]